MNFIFSALQLVLGLAFFLYGMHVMSSNLEKMAGGKLEHVLKKMTKNPLIAMALGAGITIAIQSSSASTVMLVGLVNSGIMKFSQTIYVIFGANIGTTLTSWILSLSGIDSDSFWILMLKPENFSPIIAIVGIMLLMLSKVDKKKSIGTIFVGFAVLMYGMEVMKNAVSPLADLPEFSELLVRFNNPIIGVIVGTLFTALIQSSAASVGILQALSLTGAITYNMAIPIVMGQNIGTCVTSVISCIGTNYNAKRVAAIHLSLNTIGTALFLGVYCAIDQIFTLSFADMAVDPAMIALIHTIFNVGITIILMPFSKLILKLVTVIVREKKSDKDKSNKEYAFNLDDLLLRSPSVAINECNNYSIKMCNLAHVTLKDAISLLDNYDDVTVQRVLEYEDKIDKLEDSLGTYLVKLSSQALSTTDSHKISKMLHTIGDFERLGDHAVNIVKVAKEIKDKGIYFSASAVKEINVLKEAVLEILEITNESYSNNDVELANKVEPLEQVIDALKAKIKQNHIYRLQAGDCTIELGFVLSDMLTNFERISDHCSNIAVATIELVHGSFDTHKYLKTVKYSSREFSETFDEFSMKYNFS